MPSIAVSVEAREIFPDPYVGLPAIARALDPAERPRSIYCV